MTARSDLASFYNMEDYHRVSNPGGFDNNGHRYNWFLILQDIAAVAEPILGLTAQVNRLKNVYNEDDYDAGTNPGGIGNGGHLINYIASLRDVAVVASGLGLSSAAITRLSSFYTNSNYSNDGGFGRNGHRVNFLPSLADLVTCGRSIATV